MIVPPAPADPTQDILCTLALKVAEPRDLLIYAADLVVHAGERLLGSQSPAFRQSRAASRRVESWLESGGKAPDRNSIGTNLYPNEADNQTGVLTCYYATLQLLYMIEDYTEGADQDQLIRRLLWLATDCRDTVSAITDNQETDSDWQIRALRAVLSPDEGLHIGERLRPSLLTLPHPRD